MSESSARVRLWVRYYLVATFFVIFDLEAVFLFAWCGAAGEPGWTGYCEVLIFVGVLLAALTYLGPPSSVAGPSFFSLSELLP